MAKTKKRQRGQRGMPFYRRDRDHWCVPCDPKKTPLRDRHGDMVRGADNEAKALAVWHEMMSLTNAGRAGEENPVRTVLELYLQDAERRISSKTLTNYQSWFQSFLNQWPGLLIRDLKPFHVHQWWERSHSNWGASYRNLSGSALKAAFNWASKAGKGGAIIPNNPLDGMSLPTMRKRASSTVISQEEFNRLLEHIRSETVRDILAVAWETGTRPVNLSRASAKNIIANGKALMFDDTNTDTNSAVHKTFKKTGRPLVVPLPALAREVVLSLANRYQDGPLFRTPTGLQWTDTRLANTVMHYAKQAGLVGRFTAYSCRHSRATALLEQGMTDVDVAAFLGNTPGVIHRNYSHVQANVNRLLKLAEGNSVASSGIEMSVRQEEKTCE